MILQNSTDIKTEIFYNKQGDIAPIDVRYEKHTINPNGLVQLQNIPSLHTVFTIKGKNGITVTTYNKAEVIANQYDFTVDYVNGILTFHSSQVGKEVQVSYTNAIGRLSLSADRIFTNLDQQGNVTQTLNTLIEEGQSVLSKLDTVGDAIKIIDEMRGYIDSIKSLRPQIVEGYNTSSELKKDIDIAKLEKANLVNETAKASGQIDEMNGWVENNGNIVNLNNRVTTTEGKLNTVSVSLEENNLKIGFLEQLRCRFVYGIKGDGITDETDKITRFIMETPNGGVAYFPRGKYVFSKLYIKNKGNIAIIGETDIPDYNGGKNGTIFLTTDYTTDKINFDGSYGISLKNIEIRPKDNYVKTDVEKYGDGIFLNGSGQSRIENCIIHGFKTGLKIVNCGINLIKGNRIFNCSNGIYGKECGDSQYINNYVYDISFDRDITWLKADVKNGCAMCLLWCGNSIISGGKIEWNAKGILLRDAHGVSVTDIAFDYNRGFDISCDRTREDYTYDKNRPLEHVQTDGKYNTYDIKISGNTFLSSGHFGDFTDNYYGSNISLYETNCINITGNTFSYGSWQSYANEFGVSPLYETGSEDVRKKSGAKVSFIRLRKAPQTLVVGNTFNSHYNTIPVTINDINNPISSCLYSGNIASTKPTSNTTPTCYYQIDVEQRKTLSSGDGVPSSKRGTYGYMDEIDYFTGSTRKKVYCTSPGTIKPLNEVWGSNTIDTLNVLYCSREISEEDFIIGDFITIGGNLRKIVGFYKPKDGGNHYLKLNEPLTSAINAKIELTYPSFSE